MLFPTPDPALDPVVEEWVRVAEDAFFECPPSSASIPDLASAYAELQRLEAEVEVVLRIDTADGCRLEPVARKDQPVPLVPPSAAWPVQAMETATGFYLGT